MICPHCGCFFCPDAADLFPDAPPVLHCSASCKKGRYNRRQKARRMANEASCFRKTSHPDEQSAVQAWLEVTEASGVVCGGWYRCLVCKGWHVTSGPVGPLDEKIKASGI